MLIGGRIGVIDWDPGVFLKGRGVGFQQAG